MATIRVEHLTYKYPYGKGSALVDVSMDVGDGEFVLITGPSGCGKTTLALCMSGIIPHALRGGSLEGRVLIDGVDTARMRLSEIARKVGVVLQDPESQIFGMTVEEDVAFGMENMCFPREAMVKRVNELLAFSELEGFRRKRPSSLSGGQKQRLAIISVLAIEPSTIILDEPTANLDPRGARMVLETLLKMHESGKSIVLIERKASPIMPFVDKVIALNEGHVITDCSPKELFRNRRLVNRLRINVPQTVQVAYRLEDLGLALNEIPLTVDELCA
ncbi:TPA: ATP-binding cassette domain-containing protein, partial [Candidatus Bathyarchaeota archaeon]|nr:ATP-binding cassette domain-containing protein [Candidatus Bathyarchaeota archaeon]